MGAGVSSPSLPELLSLEQVQALLDPDPLISEEQLKQLFEQHSADKQYISKQQFLRLKGETELAEYRSLKAELLDEVRKFGSTHFKPRVSYVGLLNQGATCYMNSLLQMLYMTPEFLHCVYQFSYDPQIHGDEKRCIPLQLQTLFTDMQLSRCPAVGTKSLTHSFGWTAATAFQQHDAQELCRVLFDALELATASSTAPENARFGKTLRSLYEGSLIDYIECRECGFRRERQDRFMDLQLAIKGHRSVQEALAEYTKPEVLSGENQWECDRCKKKVDAFKGLAISASDRSQTEGGDGGESDDMLPPLLTLHLMRFIYDWTTDRRVKINDPLIIPDRFDIRPYTNLGKAANGRPRTAPAVGESKGGRGSDGGICKISYEYEVFGALIHSGTATGGHYKAFIRECAQQKQLQSHLHQQANRQTMLKEAGAGVGASSDPPSSLLDRERDKESDVESDAESDWVDFNDANTTFLSERELHRIIQRATQAEGEEAEEQTKEGELGMDSTSSTMSSTMSSTNAYMLMYRRVGFDFGFAGSVERPVEGSVGEVGDVRRSPTSTLPPVPMPPASQTARVEVHNKRHRRLARAFNTMQQMVTVRVHHVLGEPEVGLAKQGADLAQDAANTATMNGAIAADTTTGTPLIDPLHSPAVAAAASGAGGVADGTMRVEVLEVMADNTSLWDVTSTVARKLGLRACRVGGAVGGVVGAPLGTASVEVGSNVVVLSKERKVWRACTVIDMRRKGRSRPGAAVEEAQEEATEEGKEASKEGKAQAEEVLVHYDGFDQLWDEWVGLSSPRMRRGQVEAAAEVKAAAEVATVASASEASAMAAPAAASAGANDVYDRRCVRLRLYEPFSARPGATFGGLEDKNLIQLLAPAPTPDAITDATSFDAVPAGLTAGMGMDIGGRIYNMLLETNERGRDPECEFEEYSPEEMRVHLLLWQRGRVREVGAASAGASAGDRRRDSLLPALMSLPAAIGDLLKTGRDSKQGGRGASAASEDGWIEVLAAAAADVPGSECEGGKKSADAGAAVIGGTSAASAGNVGAIRCVRRFLCVKGGGSTGSGARAEATVAQLQAAVLAETGIAVGLQGLTYLVAADTSKRKTKGKPTMPTEAPVEGLVELASCSGSICSSASGSSSSSSVDTPRGMLQPSSLERVMPHIDCASRLGQDGAWSGGSGSRISIQALAIIDGGSGGGGDVDLISQLRLKSDLRMSQEGTVVVVEVTAGSNEESTTAAAAVERPGTGVEEMQAVLRAPLLSFPAAYTEQAFMIRVWFNMPQALATKLEQAQQQAQQQHLDQQASPDRITTGAIPSPPPVAPGSPTAVTLVAASSATPPPYSHSIKVDVRSNLQALKCCIVDYLQQQYGGMLGASTESAGGSGSVCDPVISTGVIHLRRHAKGTQLRVEEEEELLVGALPLYDGSTVHVGNGGARRKGEFLLRFVEQPPVASAAAEKVPSDGNPLDPVAAGAAISAVDVAVTAIDINEDVSAAFVNACRLVAHETTTVAQLKTMVVDKMAALVKLKSGVAETQPRTSSGPGGAVPAQAKEGAPTTAPTAAPTEGRQINLRVKRARVETAAGGAGGAGVSVLPLSSYMLLRPDDMPINEAVKQALARARARNKASSSSSGRSSFAGRGRGRTRSGAGSALSSAQSTRGGGAVELKDGIEFIVQLQADAPKQGQAAADGAKSISGGGDGGGGGSSSTYMGVAVDEADLVVAVRQWKVCKKVIAPGAVLEVGLCRTSTASDLIAHVREHFEREPTVAQAKAEGKAKPDAEAGGSFCKGRVSVARCPNFGPPLSCRSAHRLKWNDVELFEATALVDAPIISPPWSFRLPSALAAPGESAAGAKFTTGTAGGGTILVRYDLDYAEASRRSKAAKDKGAADGNVVVNKGRAGSSGDGARKSAVSKARSRGAERGITITVDMPYAEAAIAAASEEIASTASSTAKS
jgi:ubiquitin C-terminal hydrolase